MAFPPVPFQEWFLRQTSTGNAALNAYVARVKADGGVVEAIGCVPLAVWDWAAPSFVGLLDLFPNSAAAYSLRKLRAAYSGAAVRVRESGGNTEADIGFDANGDLDTSALLAHCGANDGFVTVWYDQSLSNDATQTTAANQPKIVSAGSLVTENGKAAIDFDGSDDNLSQSLANDFYGTKDIYLFAVTKNASSSETGGITQKRDAVTTGNFGVGVSVGKYQIQARDTATGDAVLNTVNTYNTQQLISANRDASGLNFYLPEVLSISSSVADLTSTGASQIGNGGSYGVLDGTIQELVIYTSNQSTNRTAIETNIKNFWGI